MEVDTSLSDFYWKKDGGTQDLWHNQKVVTFNPVALSDEGIYECHETGKREEGKQAIIRLIVRGKDQCTLFSTLLKKKKYTKDYHICYLDIYSFAT